MSDEFTSMKTQTNTVSGVITIHLKHTKNLFRLFGISKITEQNDSISSNGIYLLPTEDDDTFSIHGNNEYYPYTNTTKLNLEFMTKLKKLLRLDFYMVNVKSENDSISDIGVWSVPVRGKISFRHFLLDDLSSSHQIKGLFNILPTPRSFNT